ncbi:Aminoglycoside phosphotransferase [Penicillium roqueforti FM164]|uniref:Altered inheritance of mitochondria protein 9, mitochondrial n=1 Tax=Penicillium roqueforti (strain FM164) TaxID=1365484 RepID=W6R7H7_PENRF|nr:Aminoglycoside phosphotransferase [Penicillium roqueforti FM164]
MSADTQLHDAAAPILFHPDLHKRNIFVSDDDPSIITGIIDWQSSSIEPAFWYADEIPDFASCSPSSELPSGNLNNSELCRDTFEVCTQFLTPKLVLPRMMDEGMFRPLRYCYRTWKDCAVAFRQELIETSRDWEALGLVGSCPFVSPRPEELAVHRKEYRCFEAAQNLKRDLSNLPDCASDGWVPPEIWEEAKLQNKAMFDGMLQAVLTNEDPNEDEPIRDERDLRDIWPFDLPDE